jgi:hypothetical protein
LWPEKGLLAFLGSISPKANSNVKREMKIGGRRQYRAAVA